MVVQIKAIVTPDRYYERKLESMGKNKNKDANNDVSFDNDQLGENKNSGSGGKKAKSGKK